MDVVFKIDDWYSSSMGIYICIYGEMKEPHKLTHYVLDKLVIHKIAYHTYVGGFGEAMIRKRKMTWPKLSLQVGSYKIEHVKQAIPKT